MIILIAAMDENRVIGRDNDIPWYLPEDFKHFKTVTQGHPIIMGRRTWESLPRKPLPNRHNIVVTRTPIEQVDCFEDLDKAISHALSHRDTVFVIGGAMIYKAAMEKADQLLISHVDGTHEGTHFFPEIGPEWESDLVSQHEKFAVFRYRRKNPLT